MRAVATLETSERNPESSRYSEDSILRFGEGLIGFSDCELCVAQRRYRALPQVQSTERDDVGSWFWMQRI
jgi:hypothetical protein